MTLSSGYRKYLWLALSLILPPGIAADRAEWTWPIRSALPGSGVILSPSSVIRNSYREVDEPFGGFVIGAAEGSEVVAVADGLIVSSGYCYHRDYLTTYSDSDYEAIASQIAAKDPEAVRWLGYQIGLKLDSGLVVWYTGLRAPAFRVFSTGQEVSRGDLLGLSAYSYRCIAEPSLGLSCDLRGRRADPSPWLLGAPDSSLPRTEARNYRNLEHPVAELKASLRTAWRALAEAHPALSAYTERAALERAFVEAEAAIVRPMSSDQFFMILQPLVALIRDNHCYVERAYLRDPAQYVPKAALSVRVGYFADGCFLLPGPEQGVAAPRRVASIDGEPVEELRERLARYAGTGDGFIESWVSSQLTDVSFLYLLDKGSVPGGELRLCFADGDQESYEIRAAPLAASSAALPVFEAKMLEGSAAYLKVRSMSFKESDKADLARFFAEVERAGTTSFVLDLRGNMGGEVRDSYFIFSFFARKPFRPELERRVRSVTGYNFAGLTENLMPGDSPYSAYLPAPGGEGYVLAAADAPEVFPTIEPQSEGRFDGDVYVLTNGRTGSAAVILGSLFRREGRGVVVGEEGANGYEEMSGLDFARLRLGETGLVLNIPLVRSVFAREGEGRSRAGRGLIPDHRIIYTADEVASGRDLELELVLRLSRRAVSAPYLRGALVVVAALGIAIAAVSVRRSRSRKAFRPRGGPQRRSVTRA